MNIDTITTKINSCSQTANRYHNGTLFTPKLIAISKLQPDERVRAVLAQGQRCFGENRVQEAAQKWPKFLTKYPKIAPRWAKMAQDCAKMGQVVAKMASWCALGANLDRHPGRTRRNPGRMRRNPKTS